MPKKLNFMKQSIIFLVLAISTTLILGQNNRQDYSSLVKKADSLYRVKDYKIQHLHILRHLNQSVGKVNQTTGIMQHVHGH